jgi:hypothetical protein
MPSTSSSIIAEKPRGKQTAVRDLSNQEVILPDGTTRTLLVIDSNKERNANFVMVFKDRNRGGSTVDDAAMGVFYKLAVMFAEYNNVCSITTDAYAELTNVSRKTAEKRFKTLIDSGYMKKIRNGVYLLSPYKIMQLQKRYFPAIERAWNTGRIEDIAKDIASIDDKVRKTEKKHKAVVRQIGVSTIKRHITVPEAFRFDNPEDQRSYIEAVKEAERYQIAKEQARDLAQPQ